MVQVCVGTVKELCLGNAALNVHQEGYVSVFMLTKVLVQLLHYFIKNKAVLKAL